MGPLAFPETSGAVARTRSSKSSDGVRSDELAAGAEPGDTAKRSSVTDDLSAGSSGVAALMDQVLLSAFRVPVELPPVHVQQKLCCSPIAPPGEES